ncbi:hypothetical protein OAN22_00320 [Alphaproteobacteria bacterium]|nr:hypothetical protein [Alphaproteobacteria bacterium]
MIFQTDKKMKTSMENKEDFLFELDYEAQEEMENLDTLMGITHSYKMGQREDD